MRRFISFTVDNSEIFKRKLAKYCSQLEHGAIYDSCDYYNHHKSKVDYHSYDCLAGLEQIQVVEGGFENVSQIQNKIQDWLFGFWTYDLKNDLEKLYSINHDGLNFPNALFFQPRFVIINHERNWKVGFLEERDCDNDAIHLINSILSLEYQPVKNKDIHFEARVNKEKYCQSVNRILEHIYKGDIYELNYCMEFYNDHAEIDPYNIYDQLINISPTPFSSFFKTKDKYAISASPERFVKKHAKKIISQPIKGTSKRGERPNDDIKLKENLRSDIKERSENIMIVDLVRNDLSRIAKKGSVEVEELCGVYPFKQVFQMISTVTAQLEDNKRGIDAIKASYPAGSMTGAPKIRAMKLIEKYEETKRGLYSGAIGYIKPDGDFDFNVVIRTLLYNSTNKYLSFMVGSAITEKSNAEKEYAECLLKAKAIFQLFNQEKL